MKTSVHFAGFAAGLLVLAGCSPKPSESWQGYIEGEFVYAASPFAGTLTRLAVTRGMEVKDGQLLFELEPEPEAAAVREAEHRLTQAKSRQENLTKGRRPTEIAGIEALLEKAKANLHLSEVEFERRSKLREGNVVSPEEFDLARLRRDADKAQVTSLMADLETARLGARVDEIKAAEAEVEALSAALVKARWALGQKAQHAPTNAWVQDTLYRQGEFVAAGRPVVSLLPPTYIKVRFFVPQAQLTSVKPGTQVSVSPDGFAAPLRAMVNYISSQAEFTPPVIYSQESRAKLVFMIEAVFDAAEARNLRPGQPVDVRLNP
jgi:HlyD family secretion protein